MNKLVLIRHGESMGNVWPEAYLNDETNFLTLRGVKQSELAGIDLNRAGFKFDHVITSGLTRSRQTAIMIMQTMDDWQRHYVSDSRLNEWNMATHAFVDLKGVVIETENQHHLRCVAALEQIVLPALDTGNVLCVTHWHTMGALFRHLLGKKGKFSLDADPNRIPNAMPYVYSPDNPGHLDLIHPFQQEHQY